MAGQRGAVTDRRRAWCVSCRRFVTKASRDRHALVAAAREHVEKAGNAGHGIWLKLVPDDEDAVLHSRVVAERAYDPARADDRREERLRGGLHP